MPLDALRREANDERALLDPVLFEIDLERIRAFIADRIEYPLTVAPVAP